jgi:hypothetical protein
MVGARARMLAVAASGLLLATLASGCFVPVSGGGFIASAGSPAAKAHFGFDLTCDSADDLVGSWVFHDKTPGAGFPAVDIDGTITDDTGLKCSASAAPAQFNGDVPYTVQGPCHESCSGNADLIVIDGGTGGKTKGDRLGIALTTGPDAGYSNGPLVNGQPTTRPLLGGNVLVGAAPTTTTTTTTTS